MPVLTFPGQPNVGYGQVINTNKFSFVGNTPKASIQYMTLWNERFQFCKGMLGFSDIHNIETASPKVYRYHPKVYEGFLNSADEHVLHAHAIESIEGVGPRRQYEEIEGFKFDLFDNEDEGLYQYAKINVSFEASTYSIKNGIREAEVGQANLHTPNLDPNLDEVIKNAGLNRNMATYITKIVQPSIEVLRLPFGYMKWIEGLEDTSKPVGNALRIIAPALQSNITGVFKMKPQEEITYIWHRVPALPRDGWLVPDNNNRAGSLGREVIGAVSTHLGCVNSTYFDGYAVNTLLLKSVEIKPYRWITGQRYYDYVFHMSHFNPIQELAANHIIKPASRYSEIGHNHFLRLQPPKSSGGTTVFVEPVYMRISSDGTDDGKLLFPERNFFELFTPLNYPYLKQKYSI